MKASLLMGIHFHQPVGNFDHVIDKVCDNCYGPFLELMSEYPGIRMSFHFTGCLLEWMEKNRPEIIDTVKNMVARGQVEMISGGFYEPILPSIPRRDSVSQINMLTEYIKNRFQYDAKGAWIAERVWEPALPGVLHEAGVKYVILDDTHFLYAGEKKENTYGYYITEDNGSAVAVFPSDKVLRYHIPFRMPGECIDYMKQAAEARENPVFIYGDDGEKFGEWPGTHKWVYDEGWLRNFFEELVKNRDWLDLMTFSECLEKENPLGRIYIPTSSYEEMLEWALPVEAQEKYESVLEEVRSYGKEEEYKPYIRGGFWRNFLTKYPESNHMNKKMLYVSDKLDSVRSGSSRALVSEEAEKDLLRAQCNCAYWHGVFGGLYLFHLRSAIYHHLIKCEKAIDPLKYGGKDFCEYIIRDIDGDGSPEVVLENRDIALYFDPSSGGILKELDSRDMCHNLMNTLSRRKEAYHRRILEKIAANDSRPLEKCESIHDAIQVTDNKLSERLVYDRYGRHGLMDHFLDIGTDLRGFAEGDYAELGDFLDKKYDFRIDRDNKKIALILNGKGSARGAEIEIMKKITVSRSSSRIIVDYIIKNKSAIRLDAFFAVEFNFVMPGANDPGYKIKCGRRKNSYNVDEEIEEKNVKNMSIYDSRGDMPVKMSFSRPARLWHFPVNTVSQSEKAYETNYQGSAFLPAWEIGMEKGSKLGLNIKIDISRR